MIAGILMVFGVIFFLCLIVVVTTFIGWNREVKEAMEIVCKKKIAKEHIREMLLFYEGPGDNEKIYNQIKNIEQELEGTNDPKTVNSYVNAISCMRDVYGEDKGRYDFLKGLRNEVHGKLFEYYKFYHSLRKQGKEYDPWGDKRREIRDAMNSVFKMKEEELYELSRLCDVKYKRWYTEDSKKVYGNV